MWRIFINKLFIYLILILGAIMMVTPFVYMVSTALKPIIYVFEYPPQFIPKELTFQNFINAWFSENFQRYFLNSTFVASLSTIFTLTVSSLSAFAFARYNFPFKEIIFRIMLFTMMIPGMVLIIPQFILAKSLGLLDKLSGLIFAYTSGSIAFNTFLLRGFFEGIPKELEEATRIDGGSGFTFYSRVVIPLSTPALATVTIFSFLANWDEYTWALTTINDPLKRTLPIALRLFQGRYTTQWNLVFAGSLIAITPVIIIFIIFQRYFIKGLTAGAIKG